MTSIFTSHKMNMDYKQLLETDNPIIFDIGSCDGTDTVTYFEQFKKPIVHCFEPYKPMFDLLKKKITELPVTEGRCYLNNMAVSDKISKEIFHVADNTMSGSLKNPTLHKQAFPTVLFTEDIIVCTITLDHYTSTHFVGYCDLVYMDVQGAEDLVFKGGKNFFDNCVKYIYTEFSYIELYEDALNVDGICSYLPNFTLISILEEHPTFGMALLKNKKF